jgi:hypothetical protein
MAWCRNYGVAELEISIFLNNNHIRKKKGRSHEAFFALKPFLSETYYLRERSRNEMEQLKATRKALTEMNESYVDLLKETKRTTQTVHNTQQLWQTGYKSKLMKIGVALIMLPEPTPISPTVGACLVAAGAAQKAVRNRSMFVEDVKKTFQTTMKEISTIKQNI